MFSQVGRRIRDIRRRKGLTQEELGNLIGVTGKFVGVVERGESNASLETLERFARALDCDLRFFFETDLQELSDRELDVIIKQRLSKMTPHEKRMLLKLISVILTGQT